MLSITRNPGNTYKVSTEVVFSNFPIVKTKNRLGGGKQQNSPRYSEINLAQHNACKKTPAHTYWLFSQTFSGLCFGLSPLWLHDSNSCVCPEMWHNHKPFYSQVCCSGVGRETGWLSTAIRCPRAATALQLPSRHSANWGLIWLAASSLTLHNHLASTGHLRCSLLHCARTVSQNIFTTLQYFSLNIVPTLTFYLFLWSFNKNRGRQKAGQMSIVLWS